MFAVCFSRSGSRDFPFYLVQLRNNFQLRAVFHNVWYTSEKAVWKHKKSNEENNNVTTFSPQIKPSPLGQVQKWPKSSQYNPKRLTHDRVWQINFQQPCIASSTVQCDNVCTAWKDCMGQNPLAPTPAGTAGCQDRVQCKTCSLARPGFTKAQHFPRFSKAESHRQVCRCSLRQEAEGHWEPRTSSGLLLSVAEVTELLLH